MSKGEIYLITDKTNGKQYVGQTIVGTARRFGGHKSSARCGRYKGSEIDRAIAEHGDKNFTIEILLKCDNADLDMFETKMIRAYNTLIPNGYNISLGGSSRNSERISTILKKYYATPEGHINKVNALLKRSETMAKERDIIRATILVKTCITCKESKPVCDFSFKKMAKDGLQPNCSNCVNKIKKEWRSKKKKENLRFYCDQCPKVYPRRDSLTRHIKEKHMTKDK